MNIVPEEWWHTWKYDLLSHKNYITNKQGLYRIIEMIDKSDKDILKRVFTQLSDVSTEYKSSDMAKCILKPLHNKCNLSCHYCSQDHQVSIKENRSFINYVEDLLKWLISENVASVQLIWHGGEPTLISSDKMKRWLQTIDTYKDKINIYHTLQTNGTLLTTKYASLLKEYNFSVGISCDGPPKINDQNRVFPNGDSSSEKIENAMLLCSSLSIPFAILTTVTTSNAKYAKDCWEYFLKFSPNEIVINYYRPPNINTVAENIFHDDYVAYIIEMFTLWFDTSGSLKEIPTLSPLNDFFALFTNNLYLNCKYSKNCGSIFQLDTRGNISPCMLLEDPNDHYDIKDILNTSYPQAQSLLNKVGTISLDSVCQTCIWQDKCNFSCPVSFFCPSPLWNLFIDILSTKLENEISSKNISEFN